MKTCSMLSKRYYQHPSDFNETNNKTKFFININHNEKYLS